MIKKDKAVLLKEVKCGCWINRLPDARSWFQINYFFMGLSYGVTFFLLILRVTSKVLQNHSYCIRGSEE